MKKYPITYKGKEYEVRWERNIISTDLIIYEVKTRNIFGKIKRKTYECRYIGKFFEEKMTLTEEDPNYYIEQVKILFSEWELQLKEEEKQEEIRRLQMQALEEWDGVIDE